MNQSRESVIVGGICQSVVHVAVRGLGSMHNSRIVYDFVQEQVGRGAKRLVVDMRDCLSMDSTFMGTLLLMHEILAQAGGSMALARVSASNLVKLSELGITSFVPVEDGLPTPPMELVKLPIEKDDPLTRVELVEQAHEQLVNKSEKGRQLFGSFLAALRRGRPEDGRKKK